MQHAQGGTYAAMARKLNSIKVCRLFSPTVIIRFPAGTCSAGGFTLVESLLAMTVLTIAFLIVFTLFHHSMQYSHIMEKRVLASVIAEKTMEEVKDWAWQKTGNAYNFDSDWTPYSGVTVSDSECPEYQVTVQARDLLLTSPCATMETAYPGEERKLHSSAKRVKVTVSWDQAGPANPGKSLYIASIVREPRRIFQSMTVSTVGSIPDPLAKESTVDFVVTVKDSGNREIKDLFFRWHVEPWTNEGTLDPGNGTIVSQSRYEGRATFAHKVKLSNGQWGYAGGYCRVKARIVYWGVEYWGTSQLIHLED